MTSRYPSASQRLARQGSTDPGDEPALSVDGRRAPDRRRVNLRWLFGAVLTGLSGAALMGGAVYTAFDGEYAVASVPSIMSGADVPSQGEASNGSRKANKVVMQAPEMSARQTIRVSTKTKVGDTEVIKVKPFAHVMATLALSRGALADQVPVYNPTKIFNTADPQPADEPEPVSPDDGEVSVSTQDLAPVKIAADEGLTLPIEQVRSLVQEQASFEAQAVSISVPPQLLGVDVDGAPEAPAGSLAYSIDGIDSLSALDVRIVPENVTDLGKTRAAGQSEGGEKTILVELDGSLEQILSSLGAEKDDIDHITQALGDKANIQAGQRLRVLMTPFAGASSRLQPARVSIFSADQHVATVAMSDAGDYVSIADPTSTDVADGSDQTDDDSDSGPGIPLYYSIYETALKQKVAKNTIEDLLRVYAYDVDLSRKTRPGDTFEVFYEVDDQGDPIGDVLFTSLHVGGDLKRYYRFVTPDDGSVDYYDADGRSARKFLMRKPMNGGEQRSGFGMRRHPILGYWKMHTGVDWADRVGTPVVAAGNGIVVKAGWTSGYGRHIEIQHQNGYTTTYSHLSGFAPGLKPRAKVSMGQVIGYLGSSGLSTGPHLHYEVKINDNFVDPMRIRLPQGRELNNALLAAFREQRDRVNEMMSSAPMARAAEKDKGA